MLVETPIATRAGYGPHPEEPPEILYWILGAIIVIVLVWLRGVINGY